MNSNLTALENELLGALKECRAWNGPGTAESLGAKCETLREAFQLADAAIAHAESTANAVRRAEIAMCQKKLDYARSQRINYIGVEI